MRRAAFRSRLHGFVLAAIGAAATLVAAPAMAQASEGHTSPPSLVDDSTDLDALDAVVREFLVVQAMMVGQAAVVQRWSGMHTFAVLGGGADDKVAVDDALAQISGITEEFGTTFRRSETGEWPTSVIYIAPHNTWPDYIPVQESVIRGAAGLTRWNGSDRNTVRSVSVMIDGGRPAAERRSIIFHELMHAIGLLGHDLFRPKSVMRTSSIFDRAKLQESDRALIRFLYAYLRRGDGVQEVRTAFLEHWANLYWGWPAAIADTPTSERDLSCGLNRNGDGPGFTEQTGAMADLLSRSRAEMFAAVTKIGIQPPVLPRLRPITLRIVDWPALQLERIDFVVAELNHILRSFGLYFARTIAHDAQVVLKAAPREDWPLALDEEFDPVTLPYSGQSFVQRARAVRGSLILVDTDSDWEVHGCPAWELLRIGGEEIRRAVLQHRSELE